MNTDWKRRMFINVEKHDLPPPDLGMKLLDAAVIIVGLLAFLALLSWMQVRDEEPRVAAKNYSHMLATCLNGGAILDRNTNIGYFCGKAIEVQL